METRQDTFIEPGQAWQIDFFRPDDADGVARLFLAVYGEHYPVRTFIEPALLREENEAGRTISAVARTPRGDIVGHNALFNSAPFGRVYESGAGVVHPLYRGGAGIFTSLVDHGQQVAVKRFPIDAIFGEPVCNHVYSQKMVAGLGWTNRALEVDLMPAAAYAKEKSAGGRVAALLSFRTIRPRPHTVYLPGVYEEPLRFLYEGLDDERRFDLSSAPLPREGSTAVSARVFGFAGVARLTVQEAGADFEPVFDGQERTAIEQGAVVIQAWLSLAWPWVGEATEALRKQGYFLGGPLPRWFDGDGLLMQKVLGRPCWDGIHLDSDRARRILDLVRADWEQTVGG
jgi:hypothetical protein